MLEPQELNDLFFGKTNSIIEAKEVECRKKNEEYANAIIELVKDVMNGMTKLDIYEQITAKSDIIGDYYTKEEDTCYHSKAIITTEGVEIILEFNEYENKKINIFPGYDEDYVNQLLSKYNVHITTNYANEWHSDDTITIVYQKLKNVVIVQTAPATSKEKKSSFNEREQAAIKTFVYACKTAKLIEIAENNAKNGNELTVNVYYKTKDALPVTTGGLNLLDALSKKEVVNSFVAGDEKSLCQIKLTFTKRNENTPSDIVNIFVGEIHKLSDVLENETIESYRSKHENEEKPNHRRISYDLHQRIMLDDVTTNESVVKVINPYDKNNYLYFPFAKNDMVFESTNELYALIGEIKDMLTAALNKKPKSRKRTINKNNQN